MTRYLIPAAVLALAIAAPTGAAAQSAADSYKGKTVEIRVGHGAGGGYDLYTRTLSRHMADHIAGKPTLVVKNMPGAGGLKLAGFIANGAPRDGSMFGLFDRESDVADAAAALARDNAGWWVRATLLRASRMATRLGEGL